jgi:hypothetical protein
MSIISNEPTPEYDALLKIVDATEKQFKHPGWTSCTWEHPGYFRVSQGGTSLCAGVPASHAKIIQVDLVKDWNTVTSWAIPYKGTLSAKKMIKAIKDCIYIYETEEIE